MRICSAAPRAGTALESSNCEKLADETGLVIHVHHYPPGTSKWNKIEHRLFSPHHAELARPGRSPLASPWSN